MSSNDVTRRVRAAARHSALPRRLQPLGPHSVVGGAPAYGMKEAPQVMRNDHAEAVQEQADSLNVVQAGQVAQAVNRRRMTDHLRRVQRQQALQAIQWASTQASPTTRSVRSATEGVAAFSGQRVSTLADEVQGIVDMTTQRLSSVEAHASRMQAHADAHGAADVPEAHKFPPALMARSSQHAGGASGKSAGGAPTGAGKYHKVSDKK